MSGVDTVAHSTADCMIPNLALPAINTVFSSDPGARVCPSFQPLGQKHNSARRLRAAVGSPECHGIASRSQCRQPKLLGSTATRSGLPIPSPPVPTLSTCRTAEIGRSSYWGDSIRDRRRLSRRRHEIMVSGRSLTVATVHRMGLATVRRKSNVPALIESRHRRAGVN